MVVVGLNFLFEFRQNAVGSLGHGISHKVQLKQLFFLQRFQKRNHGRNHHAFLYGTDAIGGVALLGNAEGFQEFFERGGRQLLQVIHKSIFFQIACQHSVLLFDGAACRRRCVFRNVKKPESGRIEDAHVTGLMRNHQGIFRAYHVQFLPGRVAVFV